MRKVLLRMNDTDINYSIFKPFDYIDRYFLPFNLRNWF